MRVTGLLWSGEEAQLEWATGKVSPLIVGAELAFVFGVDRRCIGIWRSGRRLACSTATVLEPTSRSPQCPDCQAMERSNSIAADTRLDDPRSFSVYLAHHGSVVKVGITATERGEARLLEQGALSSTFISSGSLLGARRIENLLMTTLGLPDRVSTTRKRAARGRPVAVAERTAALTDLTNRAAQLEWPEGQTRSESPIRDHTTAYGLPADGLHPDAALRSPTAGSTLSGEIACTIAGDVYLRTSAGVVLLDTYLLAGWSLKAAEPAAQLSVPLEPVEALPPPEIEQDALF
ncbi:DUF2797 domain-containing protein [Kribbella italica]|uniref:DUF2797 domain-containing protein n=1 Tax=Kribbella italica TaxID=1540520 RepID=A0A7W9JAM9_9ACTN|nr:DUF2797 domain-containing protein [Kribbella italica]MBB5837958.1 hypothetical protein [Kribbella italica]